VRALIVRSDLSCALDPVRVVTGLLVRSVRKLVDCKLIVRSNLSCARAILRVVTGLLVRSVRKLVDCKLIVRSNLSCARAIRGNPDLASGDWAARAISA
jgi:hypothetical protein